MLHAAAFLVFAKGISHSSSLWIFISFQTDFGIKISHLTLISIGVFNFLGIFFIVFTFSVTSSPTNPSQRVIA
jgi:hypothetical protein